MINKRESFFVCLGLTLAFGFAGVVDGDPGKAFVFWFQSVIFIILIRGHDLPGPGELVFKDKNGDVIRASWLPGGPSPIQREGVQGEGDPIPHNPDLDPEFSQDLLNRIGPVWNDLLIGNLPRSEWKSETVRMLDEILIHLEKVIPGLDYDRDDVQVPTLLLCPKCGLIDNQFLPECSCDQCGHLWKGMEPNPIDGMRLRLVDEEISKISKKHYCPKCGNKGKFRIDGDLVKYLCGSCGERWEIDLDDDPEGDSD